MLGSGDRLAVRTDLCQCNAGYAIFSLNIDDCMGKQQRNVKILQALDDISLQTAGIGHQLGNGFDFRTFEGHSARHNQTDIAGAEDYYLFTRKKAFHIDETLGCTGGVNACRTEAGDV